MAKDASANFDIPAEMRAFAEKSVEQARQAFDSLISATQQAAKTMENQTASARTGTKEASELAMRFAERNVAASFEFAQRLLRAKDFKEVTELQAEYVKSQMAALSEQAKELGKQAAKMAGPPR